MPTDTQVAAVSNGYVWTGRIITGLVVLFLTFDAMGKVLHITQVVEGSAKLGVPSDTLVGIGVLLLSCTLIYLVPKTAVLGAILLTGYLGGATAIHVRVRGGMFPIAFSVGFGVLVWAGLVLREPRLLWTILQRE